MSTEENKANIRRWTDEGWNQRNWAIFDEVAAPNWTFHDPGFPQVHSLEDYKRTATEVCIAFPDLHVTIDDLIAEGDKVVARFTVRGTNIGDFVTPMPLPATGKQVSVSGIAIIRFAGGKEVEAWQVGGYAGHVPTTWRYPCSRTCSLDP
jgi:predicted ester cyclase